ncbi:MAG: hypothetical protein QOF50_928, partial [Gaiellaceae bacterium]|nr:hypothetical protein [Gaiellaceae bacterium]
MEIRADHAAGATAFEPAPAIVSEASHDAAERLRARFENGPARVVGTYL